MTTRSLTTAYLVLTGMVIVTIGSAVIIIRPQIETVRHTQATLASTRVTLQDKQTVIATLDRKQAQLRSYEQQERVLSVALPTADAMEDMARLLDRAAGAAGGTVVSFSNQSAEAQRSLLAEQNQGEATGVPDQVTPLSISLSYQGSYAQLRAFIDQLEKAPRVMEITALGIKQAGETLDSTAADLTIRFYRYGT